MFYKKMEKKRESLPEKGMEVAEEKKQVFHKYYNY